VVFLAGDVWDIHVVGGGAEFFELLAGKDVDGDKMTLAWPCLPVLEVDMSTILQGRFLITTKPFLLRAEHCMG